MEIVAKDDLRNRISPRLHDFHSQWVPKEIQSKCCNGEGVVAWYTLNYQKDYCQSQFGYTCQRPAASVYGSDGTGISNVITANYFLIIKIKTLLS